MCSQALCCLFILLLHLWNFALYLQNSCVLLPLLLPTTILLYHCTLESTIQHESYDVPIEIAETALDWNATAEDLYDRVTASRDKLFVIGYINEQTFRPRWYLVRVAKEQRGTAVICPIYTVEFYAKHPNSDGLTDPYRRWWPEWHEHSLASDGVVEFGRRVLLSPKAKPNPNKFALYTDNVDLSSDLAFIGPFHFTTASTRSKQTVELSLWVCLSDACVCKIKCTLLIRSRVL
jgi:hypothetical protein